ncbi:hypothetical protein B0H14DRAFT_3142577 [Mycena olivaceomarginata]|nr:hypothetical protein B0H14DRAFT_3142577 [Mycena olivaceomarginata]
MDHMGKNVVEGPFHDTVHVGGMYSVDVRVFPTAMPTKLGWPGSRASAHGDDEGTSHDQRELRGASVFSYATCSRRAWEVLRHHVRQAEVNPSAQLRLTAWRAGAVEIQRTKSRAKQARRNAAAWMQQQ